MGREDGCLGRDEETHTDPGEDRDFKDSQCDFESVGLENGDKGTNVKKEKSRDRVVSVNHLHFVKLGELIYLGESSGLFPSPSW